MRVLATFFKNEVRISSDFTDVESEGDSDWDSQD